MLGYEAPAGEVQRRDLRVRQNMAMRNQRLARPTSCALTVVVCAGMAWLAQLGPAQAADGGGGGLAPSFAQDVQPFLEQNCVLCHNVDTAMAGVRLDQLDAALEERHLRLWEIVRRRIGDASMPPPGAPQPSRAERARIVEWISQALAVARLRPAPKNGIVRRLTVAQYRNTLRELLLLDEDLTDALPPDAVSRDGFVNNAETLQLSPLLLEAYFEIAEKALDRSIVDPGSKPSIQNFRVDLGASINPEPLRGTRILGAFSRLLDKRDFVVTQLTPRKAFAFDASWMRTKYRFVEGYEGNATVRGWRDFDSIYHAVFACVRGSPGYPKGSPYSTVPQGLLLRPAIPSDEIFGLDNTYGPKANFKLSLRELPDYGRFRVTVTAAKYNDGLLLDPGTAPREPPGAASVLQADPTRVQAVSIPEAGIYQVDVYEAARREAPGAANGSRLGAGLAGSWPLDGPAARAAGREHPAGRLEGDARFVDSPFGKAVALDGYGDAVVIPGHAALNVGQGDFTVAAWMRPRQLRRAGIVVRGGLAATHGWSLDMPSDKGVLRLATIGPDARSNGAVASPPGVVLAAAWQHVAAVVRRGQEDATLLYINGYRVGKGKIGAANLDNPRLPLQFGLVPNDQGFEGELDEVRLYRRALDETELQALVEPGRGWAKPPPETPQEVTLTLGALQAAGALRQPAFLAARLEAGALQVGVRNSGVRELERIVLTPLGAEEDVARRFRAFEKRAPRLGVHLGLRRDCGSTLARVGSPQTVAHDKLARFVFEGSIRNFPSPDVEADNVNYLAGIREIGVRSEYTDGRDMPRLLIRSVEFEGPFYETWPPPSHRSIFIEFDRPDDLPDYAREIIRAFATRAYRRPITAPEESALLAVFQSSFRAGTSFRESVKHVLQVVLTAPQFLFLVENSSTPEPEPLDDHELASKLSYFLWNAPPDQSTLRLAAEGTLRQHMETEVARMIAAPQSSQFVREFASQWLNLDKFDVLEPDRERFPKLTWHTRAQLRQEPVQFVEYLLRNNLPVRNLIESEFVLANDVVARYYDLAGQTESGFRFVPIRHGRRELGGVLSQAAILAGLSDGRDSNPVKRGAWLARRIIADPPDDPPPNVPELPPDTQGLSLRERLARHREQPGCVQCHEKIDPWGVPLEEFNAGGRLQDAPVDARSKLPDDTQVSGFEDLKRYLGQQRIDQVAFSVLKHLATYAHGRSLTYAQLDDLQRDGLALKASGYRLQDMIRHIVQSNLFLEK